MGASVQLLHPCPLTHNARDMMKRQRLQDVLACCSPRPTPPLRTPSTDRLPPAALLLQGLPRDTSALVDAHVIGTDALFNEAGTVSRT